jgi:membrane-bound ClpP family serine protease
LRCLSVRAVALALIAFAYLAASASAQPSNAVVVGRIDGIVNSATARYVDRVIADAEQSSAPAVVFYANTPGGISDDIRAIDLGIERSRVPVLIYTAGKGYLANRVGIIPATTNSVGADYSASDVRDLLRQVDGATVQVASGPVTLDTASAPTRPAPMSAFESLLHTIANPTIAYLLLCVGSLGLLLELFNPGSAVPGVVGGICLILALYALGTLPLNLTGLGLVAFGLLLFGLEPFLTAHGILALGGAVAFGVGSMLLIDTHDAPSLQISPVVIGSATTVMAGFFLVLVGFILRTRGRRALTGHEGLVGAIGVVRRDIEPGRQGMVLVLGELWRATTAEGRLVHDERVIVQRVEGLVLVVQRAGGLVRAPRPAAPATAKSRAAGA